MDPLTSDPGMLGEASEQVHRQFPKFVSWIIAVLQSWQYPPLERRDLRLDLLRGFAVLVMVVDHSAHHRAFLFLPSDGGV